MKSFKLLLTVGVCLFIPYFVSAQSTGRVECPRNDGYVYLYSSFITLEVRATLQCGEVVHITGRDDAYLAVRTAKGDTGFVPMTSVVLLKDLTGPSIPEHAAATIDRERTPYDERQHAAPPVVTAPTPGFALPNGVAIRMKIVKTITSATAHVGDPVEFEVLEDIAIDGVVVVSKGAKATGVIAEADPKKRFGHGGKIAFNITSVSLANNQQAPVRCYQESTGSSNTSSDAVMPLSSGKEASILQDAQFTALVTGNFPLKRESFSASTATPTAAAPADSTQPRP
jgi:hypothetical protein